MANLSHLEVNNFRCFDHVELDGLTNVNLFVGKNSAGKSTLLEGILNAYYQIVVFGNSRVEYQDKCMDDFRLFFHNLDIKNNVRFEASFYDGEKRTLEITANSYDMLEMLGDKKNGGIKNLKCDCKIVRKSGELPFSYFIKWNSDGFAIKDSHSMPDEISHRHPYYLSPNIIDRHESFINEYRAIVKRKEKDILLKELQSFDSRVKNVDEIEDICFDVEGVNEYLPLNFMGGGFRRYFSILVPMLSHNSECVFIDEIENGLHYSNLSKLWNALIQFSVRNKIQLFLTTHSLETMESLKNVLEDEEMAEYRDKVKVFKVAKTEKKGYQTYGYGFNEFQTALNSLIEMR